MDIEANPDLLNHIAMCLDLGLDPENPKLEWVEPRSEFWDRPWLEAWMQKEYDSDIDWWLRENFIKRSKNQPKIEVNNIVR